MNIKVKVAELLKSDSVLDGLLKRPIGGKLAMGLARITKAIKDDVDAYRAGYDKLMDQYGEEKAVYIKEDAVLQLEQWEKLNEEEQAFYIEGKVRMAKEEHRAQVDEELKAMQQEEVEYNGPLLDADAFDREDGIRGLEILTLLWAVRDDVSNAA